MLNFFVFFLIIGSLVDEWLVFLQGFTYLCDSNLQHEIPKPKMKNLITSAFLFLALLLPATATAYSFKYGGVDYTITGINTVEVSTRQQTDPEYQGDVAIPATVTHKGITFTVTAIGDWAFWNCKDLTCVTIPSSVTTIGEAAFRDCSGLTSVSITNIKKVPPFLV